MKVFKEILSRPPAQETGILTLGQKSIDFTIIRNRRRKRRIAFIMESPSGLRIMAPLRTRRSVIERLLHSRADWIAYRMEQFNGVVPRSFSDGEALRYLGHTYILRITRDDAQPQACHVKPREFRVNITDKSLSDEALRQEVRLEILLWMKSRARVKFKKRMDFWARRLNVTYKKLTVVDPQQQWGSCSAENVVRLSWRLLLAPLPLLDYVVAHELCHVVHKNHSRRFWKLLETVMPDWNQRRRQLKKDGPTFTL